MISCSRIIISILSTFYLHIFLSGLSVNTDNEQSIISSDSDDITEADPDRLSSEERWWSTQTRALSASCGVYTAASFGKYLRELCVDFFFI